MFDKNLRGGYIVPPFTMVGEDTIFPNYSEIGHHCHIGNRCRFGDGVSFGHHSLVGTHCVIGNRARIQNDVSFGAGCYFGHHTYTLKGAIFNNGSSFGSECTFGDRCSFMGSHIRIGDQSWFGDRPTFTRPVIVGVGSMFLSGRPDLAVDPHQDVIRREKESHRRTK